MVVVQLDRFKLESQIDSKTDRHQYFINIVSLIISYRFVLKVEEAITI